MHGSESSSSPRGLDALLVEHLPRLRAFIRLRTNAAIRARESHSDLVQSVCREVLEGAERFEFQGDGAFRKWLYVTALRKLVERDREMKAQKRDVRRELDAAALPSDGEGLAEAYASVSTPSLAAMRREDIAMLEAAFEALSDEQREVVTLARIVGLTHAEIAEHLGKTEEACRQILRRGLIRLELALEERGAGS